MYQALTFANGVVIAIAVSINAGLTSHYGALLACVIIHAVGLGPAAALWLVRRGGRRLLGHSPAWIYLGGLVGVGTTIFQSAAATQLSITATVALCLLGQIVTSLAIDALGLFGARRQAVSARSAAGLVLSLAGIAVMLGEGAAAPVPFIVLSLLSGFTTVVSRTLNAVLSKEVGVHASTFVNFALGFAAALLIAGVALMAHATRLVVPDARPWAYLGGVISIAVVSLHSVTVPRVSAFMLTLLSFVGQVAAGVVIDLVVVGSCSIPQLAGGLVITAGILANRLLERGRKPKQSTPAKA